MKNNITKCDKSKCVFIQRRDKIQQNRYMNRKNDLNFDREEEKYNYMNDMILILILKKKILNDKYFESKYNSIHCTILHLPKLIKN